MPLIFTGDPQFCGFAMSLSNILMISLFRSSNRIVIFLKSHIAANMKGGCSNDGDLKICQMASDFFIFKPRI